MSPDKFEKEYRIHVYETGPDGRISLYSLFNYMQDIASEHAEKLGFGRNDLMKKNHFWVLSRMYAVISEWPAWNDTLIVKTWPTGTEKVFAIRNYELRLPDKKMIASAASSWLIIDRTTKKIQRPDSLLTRYDSADKPAEQVLRSAEKLPDVSLAGSISPVFNVKVSDLDINHHTNNVNYIKWVTDTYDLNFILNHHPTSIEINYLSESVFGEDILIRTSQEEGSNCIFNHSVFRINDNKELCKIRLEWKEGNLIKS